MKDKIRISCPAKINLSLDVIGKRADGYHELKMIIFIMLKIFFFKKKKLKKTYLKVSLL